MGNNKDRNDNRSWSEDIEDLSGKGTRREKRRAKRHHQKKNLKMWTDHSLDMSPEDWEDYMDSMDNMEHNF